MDITSFRLLYLSYCCYSIIFDFIRYHCGE